MRLDHPLLDEADLAVDRALTTWPEPWPSLLRLLVRQADERRVLPCTTVRVLLDPYRVVVANGLTLQPWEARALTVIGIVHATDVHRRITDGVTIDGKPWAPPLAVSVAGDGGWPLLHERQRTVPAMRTCPGCGGQFDVEREGHVCTGSRDG